MVDATVSMVLKRLAPIIEQRVQEEVCLLINSPDEAKKLAAKLKKIQEVLRDAERQGVTDPRVKSWLDKLQDISYDIDDALDEWDWENISLQMEELEDASQSADPWKKVSSFLQSACLCFKRVVERRNINLNIKQLNQRLDLVGKENEEEFKFIPNVSHDSPDFKRIITASFVDVSEVHGREDDKEILVSKLLSESSSCMQSGVPIISVVGAGGMGKTTLAQIVFNDDKVKNHFQVKIWVCVSHPFDEIKIANAILKAQDKNFPNLPEFETLLQCIVDYVSGKNFLLVLDDVWTEDDTMWKPLRICLNNGNSRSRILVTTRNMKVAEVMGSTQMQIQSLGPLLESYCWKVFSQIAFQGREERERENLKGTGLEIVKKCKGLPLAVKAIGSLLHFKKSLEEWEEVLESPMWELEKARKDIFPFLVLSYDELHPTAKRCFSYCAIFPKDEEIRVDMLIRIWCAQGFLSSMGSSGDIEVKGREIFDNLAMRSFFQDFEKDEKNDIVVCKMHDIIHDFAQFLTENECLIVENADDRAKSAHYRSARHLHVLAEKDKLNIYPISILHENCRSFLTERNAIPPKLLGHLKRVRVLILDNCELEFIPREIGSLIHLRYLDLSWNFIKELPETICDLYNLQTLILRFCQDLSGLPPGIHKLRNLRHLINEQTSLEFPEEFEQLTNLQTLSEIHASPRRNWKNLRMLRNLNQLRDSLSIFVEGSDDADGIVEAAEEANLKNKKFIQRLRLSYDGKVPFQVIETLQPHLKLQSLNIRSPCLPKWVTALTDLRELSIRMTNAESEMGSFSSVPPLGILLPTLETLALDMPGMKRLSREFFGIDTTQTTESCVFPRLKNLYFFHCREWEEWEDISEEDENNINISILPSLEDLTLYGCSKLTALPHRLLRKASSIKHLEIFECDNLSGSYKDWDRASQIHGLTHIPTSGVVF